MNRMNVADLDCEYEQSDSLFGSFNIDTFYKEIQRSPEYQCETERLMGGKGFIKLETGITIIMNGEIKGVHPLWTTELARRPCQPNTAQIN